MTQRLIIDKFEENITARRTDPENEADAFLAYLIEDFADEWLLWPFFMHRWRLEVGPKTQQPMDSYMRRCRAMSTMMILPAQSEFWANRQMTRHKIALWQSRL